MPVSRPGKATRSPAVAARCERRNEEILEAAIRLFAKHGYADADLQVLADKLGIGKGTLYRHFGNKQELFLAAADRVMTMLFRHIDAAAEGVSDPLDQIERRIAGYLEFFETHPEAVEIFIQERAVFRDRKRPTYFVHREANLERWRGIWRDLIAEGRVRPLCPERITDVIGDQLYGAMFVNYITGRHSPPAEAARDIVAVVFHGILTDEERRRREPPTPRKRPG